MPSGRYATSTWPNVCWSSRTPTTVSVRSGRARVTVSPTASPSSAAVAETTIPSSAPTRLPSATAVGATNEPGSTPTRVRSTGEPSSWCAFARSRPYGAASSTPGCSAMVPTWSVSMTDRVNAASVPVPSSNAKSVTGVRLRPETPSLTRPADSPESRTTRTATSATTPPMSRKRVRAKTSSRNARNMRSLPMLSTVRRYLTNTASTKRRRPGRRGRPGRRRGRRGSGQPWARSARFTADTMALSEAVVIDGSIPTPHRTSSPTWHSTYAAAVASPPSESACSA